MYAWDGYVNMCQVSCAVFFLFLAGVSGRKGIPIQNVQLYRLPIHKYWYQVGQVITLYSCVHLLTRLPVWSNIHICDCQRRLAHICYSLGDVSIIFCFSFITKEDRKYGLITDNPNLKFGITFENNVYAVFKDSILQRPNK